MLTNLSFPKNIYATTGHGNPELRLQLIAWVAAERRYLLTGGATAGKKKKHRRNPGGGEFESSYIDIYKVAPPGLCGLYASIPAVAPPVNKIRRSAATNTKRYRTGIINNYGNYGDHGAMLVKRDYLLCFQSGVRACR